MKKDLKQALNTYRHVVRIFSNKSTNFANTFGSNLAEFTSMLIGSRFIDLSSLSANPIKFGKKFGILVKKSTQIKDKTLLWEDIRKQKSRAKKFLQKSVEFGYEKASSVSL